MDREALNDYPMGKYDVTVVITAFEPDREIAWTILGQIEPPIGHVYGYRLEPTDEGTLVTSYYDWSEIDPVWREADIFPILSEGALRATLGILARTVARGYPRAQTGRRRRSGRLRDGPDGPLSLRHGLGLLDGGPEVQQAAAEHDRAHREPEPAEQEAGQDVGEPVHAEEDPGGGHGTGDAGGGGDQHRLRRR